RAAGSLGELARSQEDLAGDEEGDQHLDGAMEILVPADQVVLVAAIGVAGRVGVVLEEVDLASDALFLEALLGRVDQALENPLPRLVVCHHVDQRIALRSRVLGVAADVEVEASAVLEEHIRRTAPGHDSPEEITGNLIRARSEEHTSELQSRENLVCRLL